VARQPTRRAADGWEEAKPVVIEDNPRSIPANTVVVGNPARVIREIEQF
jgi:hypothetical protein